MARSRQRSEAAFALQQSELVDESVVKLYTTQTKPASRPHSQTQKRDAIYKRAILPKTATNFYNMQKGLYMKTLKTP